MSGSYRQLIGPARKRLDNYLADVLKKKNAKSYKSAEICQVDIDKIRQVCQQLEQYRQQWQQLFMSVSDETRRADEEKLYSEFAYGENGFIDKVNEGYDAILFLEATRNAIIYAISPTPTALPPQATTTITTTPAIPTPTYNLVYAENDTNMFDGNIFAFNEWHQIFKADVDDQPIPDIKKFTKLKKCLTGDAAAAIAGLPVVSQHYKEALTTLEERFGKSESVKSALFTKIKNLAPANDDTSSLRKTYEEIVSICRQLIVLGEDMDHQLMIQTIFGKFPESTMLAITNVKTLGSWKYDELRQKINTIISSKEDVHRLYQANRPQPSNSTDEALVFSVKTNNNKFNNKKQKSNNRQPQQQQKPDERPKPDEARKCLFCDGNHSTTSCQTYPAGDQRTARLKEINRCLICLQTTHSTSSCAKLHTAKCYNCQKYGHHTIICWKKYPNKSVSKNETPKKGQRQQQQRKPAQRGVHAVNASQLCQAYYTPVAQNTTNGYAPIVTYPPPTPSGTPNPYTVMQQYPFPGINQNPAYYPHASIMPPQQIQERPQNVQTQVVPQSAPKTTTHQVMSTTNTVEIESNDHSTSMQTLLLTKKCRIINPHAPENSIWATVFFDNGSQKSFVHDKIKSFLNLHAIKSSPVLLHTFGSDIPQPLDTPTVEFIVATVDNSYIPMEAQIVNKMIQPMQSINITNADLKMMVNADCLQFADKTEADILIGNDFFWNFMLPETVQQLPSGFHLIQSRVGPMITGHGRLENCADVSCYTVMTSLISLVQPEDEKSQTDAELHALEDVETIGIKDDPYQDDEAEAEKFITDNIEIDPDGRYQVPWLWKTKNPNFSSNFAMAFSQLRTMLSRIRALPNAEDMTKHWINYFKELFDLKIIELAPEDSSDPTVFLPHHVVLKPGSETTKFRVVFNGSAKQKDGEALNENLYAGPIKIPDLGGILLRFREKKHVIISDLEKAFLQVGLKPCDRNTTCFLWLKDPYGPVTKDNLLTLRFTRVAFGIISSAYLLAAVITHHLKKYGTPLSWEILKSIYIDNVLFAADTTEEAIAKFHESIQLFKTAKMNLRDHISNSPELNQYFSQHQRIPNGPHKILGIPWDIVTDSLIMKSLKMPENIAKWTKRNVLKTIAQAFDPLGFLSPVHLKGKIFFQSLWKKSYSWDQPLDDVDKEIWLNILTETCGATVCIPRYLLKNSQNAQNAKFELHVFVDASKYAYAVACYLKIIANDSTTTMLIFSKSRLTPSKGLSIPKLELLGLFIGVKSAKFIIKEMNYNFDQVYFWTDSHCVIYWINSRKEQKRFIENRLKFIRSFPNANFRYVPTKLNPADLATRGVAANEIQNLKIWWHGPDYLHNEAHWPTMPEINQPPKEIEPTYLSVIVESTTVDNKLIIKDFIGIQKFNSLDSLIMTTYFVSRFLIICGKSKLQFHSTFEFLNGFSSVITIAGMNYRIALMLLIKITQSAYPPSSHEISTIHIYTDKNGILRCRPRVRLYGKADTRNHAIFLPRKGHLTQLVIAYIHKLLCHCGAAQTLANVRKQYWIPKARTIVRSVIKHCYQCRRMNGKSYALPRMADLPEERLRPSKPFQFIGLDMIGPLNVKTHEKVKTWICIFTCLTTRAVHLEYVMNLSAPTFVQCLIRCFSRRGLPDQIISDNASQFVLASKAYIAAYPVEKLTWRFNVPLAPWQGGIFERLVAIVKNAFRRSIGRRCLGLEEFRTFICQVENTLNCRPITAVNNDIDSHNVLRPIDFLIPEFTDPSISIEDDRSDPEYLPPNVSSKVKLVKHWEKTLQHLHALWDFWTTDYLTLLRERMQSHHKGRRNQVNEKPVIGEIVIVQDENLPKTLWQLAKIVKLHKSPDGEIRSATVLFKTGNELRRPLNLLYPLEIRDSTDEIPIAEASDTSVNDTQYVPDATVDPKPTQRKTQKKFAFGIKSTYLTLMIIAFFIPATQTFVINHKCPNDINLKRIDVQDCATQGMAVMQKPNGELCWKLISCSNGIDEPRGFHCNQNCTCPSWAEGCSFYNGKLTSDSTSTNEAVQDALKAESPHVCSFTSNENCLEQPHIGRFPKIILYDNSSHLVNELHLYRKEIIPDEFTCIGEGKTVGSPRYCELYSCHPNGPRFCYFKKAEAVFLITDNGDVLIKAWGTVLLTYYKHKIDPNENADCSNCTLTCSNNGVELRLVPNIGNLRVCYGAICQHKMHPHIIEKIELPTQVLLTTHKVSAVLWSNGFVVQKLIKTCPPKEICSLIKCYFCWEIIGNPHCMPKEAIFATAAVLYIILMIIHYMIKIFKRSVKLIQYSTQLLIFIMLIFTRIGKFIKNLIWKCVRMCFKVATTSRRNHINEAENINLDESPQPMRHNPFLYVPRSVNETIITVGIIVCLIGAVSTCSEFSSISAIQESCLIESTGLVCTFNQQTLLSLSPHGQASCLILKNNLDENIGLLTLNVAKVAAYCKPSTQYFTREYIIKSKSSKRCRSAGSCHDSNCEDTELQSKITELNGEANDSPGYTYCAASCGCITCSCFYCSPGCLFWRTYAIPKSEKIYEIFSCSSWEQKVKMDMVVKIGNVTEKHTFTLIPGQTVSWNHFKVSLVSTSLPTVPYLNTKFITDYRRIAVAEVSAPGQQIPGTIGDFQCRTFEDAKKFNCNFPPNACRCHTLETKANCVCASDQLQKLFNNGDQLLPLEIAGTTFEGWEKTVRAMYSTPSAIQLQMQIQNLKVTTMISNSKCTVAFNKLIGCYNCNTGAEVKATCKTDFGSPLAYVTCAGSTAAISCNPAGHTETLKFQFQESKIDINCKVKCPNTETESKLKGDLAFVGHDVHSSYHLIAADEINAASSLDFNFLFNWFSLQHHWLLLIAAFILIFVVIMIVVKNLPVFQAVNILSSMVKKEL